jgi:hypothetical protein
MRTRLSLMLSLLFFTVFLAACRTAETPDPTPLPPLLAVAEETAADPTPEPGLPEPETAVPTPELVSDPTAEPAAGPTIEADSPYPFQLTADIAAAADMMEIPAADSEPGMAPYWAVYPAHVEYRLEEYVVSDHFHTPRIMIYPARDYSDLNVGARENIDSLRRLLTDKPALTSGLHGEDSLPFMPLFNAAQVFAVHAEYLTFASGEGIRYLTYYSQAYMPVTNNDLFYTFQGLTSDGAYYVAAVLPIVTADLPNSDDIDLNAFFESMIDEEDIEEYMRGVIETLAETPAAFTPSLNALDEMMQSVTLPPLVEAVGDGLAIRHPLPRAQLPLGATITVEGFAPAGAAEVEISLVSGPAVLVTTTAVPNADRRWAADIVIPANLQGPARLIVNAGDETVSQPVELLLHFTREQLAANPDAYRNRPISLFQPMPGQTGVSGSTLFFAGMANNLLNDTITIGLLADDCSRFVAQQSFTVTGGSGGWNGQIILPQEIEPQDACAIAYTGAYGEGEWGGVQIRLPIVSPQTAAGWITAVLPLSGEAAAGQPLFLEGTAVGAPEDIVLITISDSADSDRVLASVEAAVNNFYYWQATILLPADFTGFALIIVTMPGLSEGDGFYQTGLNIR